MLWQLFARFEKLPSSHLPSLAPRVISLVFKAASRLRNHGPAVGCLRGSRSGYRLQRGASVAGCPLARPARQLHGSRRAPWWLSCAIRIGIQELGQTGGDLGAEGALRASAGELDQEHRQAFFATAGALAVVEGTEFAFHKDILARRSKVRDDRRTCRLASVPCAA